MTQRLTDSGTRTHDHTRPLHSTVASQHFHPMVDLTRLLWSTPNITLFLLTLIFPTECGEPLLIIPLGGALTLTSYRYPEKYHKSIHCQWIIRTEARRKISVKFSDLSLEENYDFLHMGTSRQPRMLSFTGRTLPLDVVFSENEIAVVFETDHSISDRGFSILVKDAVDINSGNCFKPHQKTNWPVFSKAD